MNDCFLEVQQGYSNLAAYYPCLSCWAIKQKILWNLLFYSWQNVVQYPNFVKLQPNRRCSKRYYYCPTSRHLRHKSYFVHCKIAIIIMHNYILQVLGLVVVKTNILQIIALKINGCGNQGMLCIIRFCEQKKEDEGRDRTRSHSNDGVCGTCNKEKIKHYGVRLNLLTSPVYKPLSKFDSNQCRGCRKWTSGQPDWKIWKAYKNT